MLAGGGERQGLQWWRSIVKMAGHMSSTGGKALAGGADRVRRVIT